MKKTFTLSLPINSVVKHVFFLCLFFSFFSVCAQKREHNFPPGYYVHYRQKYFDLSYKLDGKKGREIKEISQQKLVVLKNITDDELKDTTPEYQAYVAKGKQFLASLSPRVKSIYTEIELWYIFATDKKLMERLKTIQ